jgi:cell division protein FtsL
MLFLVIGTTIVQVLFIAPSKQMKLFDLYNMLDTLEQQMDDDDLNKDVLMHKIEEVERRIAQLEQVLKPPKKHSKDAYDIR